MAGGEYGFPGGPPPGTPPPGAPPAGAFPATAPGQPYRHPAPAPQRPFSAATAIEQAFRWLFHDAGGLLVPMLLFMVLQIAIVVVFWFVNLLLEMLVGIVFFAIAEAAPKQAAFSQLGGQLTNYAAGFLVEILAAIPQGFLVAGLTTFMLAYWRGQQPRIGVLFSGGRHLLSMALATFLFQLAVQVGSFVLCVGAFFVTALLTFHAEFIVDRGEGVFQAFASSARLATSSFGQILLLVLLWVLLVLVGALPCGIPLLVVIPAIFLSQSYTYLMLTGEGVRPVRA